MTYRMVCTILGCGSSRGSPTLESALRNPQATLLNPEIEPRHNPSFLVQVIHDTSPQTSSSSTSQPSPTIVCQVLVDMGKTFRASMLDHLRRIHQTPSSLFFPGLAPQFDAILMTHSHQDAVGGIDDIRELMPDDGPQTVVADAETMSVLKRTMPYLFRPNAHGLFVGSIAPQIAVPFQPFTLGPLQITPVPLNHGAMACMGYVFQLGQSQVAYFSDMHALQVGLVSTADEESSSDEEDERGKKSRRLVRHWAAYQAHQPFSQYLAGFVDPAKTIALLRLCRVAAMVVDALHVHRPYPSHMSWFEMEQMLVALQQEGVVLGPDCGVYTVGMSGDLTRRWFEENRQRLALRAFMSYDGLQFIVDDANLPADTSSISSQC